MAECSEQICMFKAGRLADGVNMLLLNCYLTHEHDMSNRRSLCTPEHAFHYVLFLTALQLYLSEVSWRFGFHEAAIV